MLIASPTSLVIGSGVGTYLGSLNGLVILTARLLSYIGTYISLPSAFRCAWQLEQLPCRNNIAMALICSPAARPKKALGLLTLNDHLLVPAGGAMAADSVEPQVN